MTQILSTLHNTHVWRSKTIWAKLEQLCTRFVNATDNILTQWANGYTGEKYGVMIYKFFFYMVLKYKRYISRPGRRSLNFAL